MSRVYISFLGLGTKQPSGNYAYNQAVYELNGEKSTETEFVQVAEIENIGTEYFDRLLIVATERSYDLHFENLKEQLCKIGVRDVIPLIINEDMSATNQWKWFEQILDCIEKDDELTVDLTHGYRSTPIVFSTAINFLQKARGVKLNAVYYGAYEKIKDLGYAPLVDMKDFYIINEWAEAVSRLVEDADARKMAEVAEKTPEFQVGELNDERIINAFADLTNTIRNVDINNVAEKADTAIGLINEKEKEASLTGKVLLKLVVDKFTSLASDGPISGKYDKSYFLLQLEIIKLLLEHKLFMQAYTVMREFIGSIGLIEIEKANILTGEGRRQRRKADVFANMLRVDEKKWKFKDEQKIYLEKLLPYYKKLKSIGVETILRDFSAKLIVYRNGFDHAWTSKPEAYADIEQKGREFFQNLNKVVCLLEKNKILS